MFTRLRDEFHPKGFVNGLADADVDGTDRYFKFAALLYVELPCVHMDSAAYRGLRLILLSTNLIYDGENAPLRNISTLASESLWGGEVPI
jgi:dTDP-4-dehydrorhamnose reductase